MMIWSTGLPTKDGLYIVKLKGDHWPREPHTLHQIRTAVWHGNTFTYLDGYFEKNIIDIEGWYKLDI